MIKQWLKDFTHNAIIHPLMMFLPPIQGQKLHNWNAGWAFNDDRYPSTESLTLTSEEGLGLGIKNSDEGVGYLNTNKCTSSIK